jgi:hypothetical protein
MKRQTNPALVAGFFLAVICFPLEEVLSAAEDATADSAINREVSSFQPLPNLFPIMPWDTLHSLASPQPNPEKGLENIAHCHFTLAGFVLPEDLPHCRKLGLLTIMAPKTAKAPSWKQWLNFSDEEIEAYVKSLIGVTAKDATVLGYYISDEPTARHFRPLAKAVAAVKKHAPGKLAYVNLFPNYSTLGAVKSRLGTKSYEDYLERFVREVKPQLISYDNYTILHSDDMQDAKAVSRYYTNLLQIRDVALRHKLPYWNIVCSSQIRPKTTVPSPANLALQAYTSLAAGFRGICWYKFFYYGGAYSYSSFDSAGNRTNTWLYLQTVNRQLSSLGPVMNCLESTGVFFSEPPPGGSLPRLPGRIVKHVSTTTSPRKFADVSPPVMVGEFRDRAGADYVMIVNLSLERSMHFDLETVKSYQRIQVFGAVDGKFLPLTEREGHWLTPGQGELVTLE